MAEGTGASEHNKDGGGLNRGTPLKSIICMYHAPCNDGAASAAALEYRFRKAGYSAGEYSFTFLRTAHTNQWLAPYSAEYISGIHPSGQVQEIFLVDVIISGPKHRQLLEHLAAHGYSRPGHRPRTICIDHHATAIDKLGELGEFCDETDIRIGTGLSGATLVWEYCNRRFGQALPMPDLLRYVADQDIWEWLLPDSAKVNAALNAFEGVVEEMREELEYSINHASEWRRLRAEQGEAVMAMTANQVHKAMAHVQEFDVGEYTLLVVNGTAFSSELGNHLCQHHQRRPQVLALIYAIESDWSVKCSVRSLPGSKTTARAFAEGYGGGGHDNAAGCRFSDLTEFRSAITRLINP